MPRSFAMVKPNHRNPAVEGNSSYEGTFDQFRSGEGFVVHRVKDLSAKELRGEPRCKGHSPAYHSHY